MRIFSLSVLTVCGLALSQLQAGEDTQHIQQRLEAAKADSKRFKSALLRTQQANREQVEKLTRELKLVQEEREKLESKIQEITNEGLTISKSLEQKFQISLQKSKKLSQELETTKKASTLQIEKLTNELTVARKEAGKLQEDLISARKGNSAQVESLESELKTAHQRLQKTRNDLAEAKAINAKQLKNFTAWLYNAKTEAEGLRIELTQEKTNFDEKLLVYRDQLKESDALVKGLQLQLAKVQKEHQDELLEINEKFLISQADQKQLRDNLMQERYERNQEQAYKPLCDDRPDPTLFCWRADICKPTTWARAELLYWTAEASDLDFVIPEYPVPGASALGLRGKVEEAKFGWDPGFRIEIGHRFKPDLWDIAMQYTFERISGEDDFSNPNIAGQTLMPTQTNQTSQNTQSTQSSIDLDYSVVDLMLGRTFLPTKQLFIRPSMGLTGAWIDRDFEVKYNGAGDTPNVTRDRYTSEFSGGGMRIGADFDWYMGKGFSIYAKTSVAALLGYYRNTTKSNSSNANNPALAAVDVENSVYDDNRIATHIQMQLGPNYGIMWDDFGLSIFAGYEVNAWFNVEELRSGDLGATTSGSGSRRITVNDSNLGLHGFVGKLQFNF